MTELVTKMYAVLAYREHLGNSNPRRKELAKCYGTIVALYDRIEELEEERDKLQEQLDRLHAEVRRLRTLLCTHDFLTYAPDADGRMSCPVCHVAIPEVG